MFRTGQRTRRGMAVGALILSLSATTFGGSANAAPAADQKTDCSTLAHTRNDLVHKLHDSYMGFREQVKVLAHDARELARDESHSKSATNVMSELRRALADSRAKLQDIWSAAHAKLQDLADLGQACADADQDKADADQDKPATRRRASTVGTARDRAARPSLRMSRSARGTLPRAVLFESIDSPRWTSTSLQSSSRSASSRRTLPTKKSRRARANATATRPSRRTSSRRWRRLGFSAVPSLRSTAASGSITSRTRSLPTRSDAPTLRCARPSRSRSLSSSSRSSSSGPRSKNSAGSRDSARAS